MKHPYCTGCGLRAPRTPSACPVCGARESLTVTTDVESLIVAAEIWFACGACGRRSPLDAIEPDARAQCRRCGERQALADGYHRAALRLAHGVANFVACAEQNEADVPPEYAALGVTAWTIDVPFGKEREHLLRVGFGALRCPTCGSFGVRWEGRKGALTITCGECGTARYDAARAWSLYKHAAAVVTPAHRTDVRRAPARADRRGRASVCPTCAAPLVRGVGQPFAKCAFCATTSCVKPRATGEPPAVRFTILFASESGPRRPRA